MGGVVFQGCLHNRWRGCFTDSHLSYTSHKELQCQAAVKVPGSFRPVAGSEHLYSHCNFAESLVETVPESLRHSCRSELHRNPRVSSGDRLCLHLAQLIDDDVGIEPSLTARVHPSCHADDLNQSSWLKMLLFLDSIAHGDEQIHIVLLA